MSIAQLDSAHVGAALSLPDPRRPATLLAERVRETASTFGCECAWARAAGRHVILGVGEDEAFARVTPLGDHAFALSFRSPPHAGGSGAGPSGFASASKWEPLLLIDSLTDVVEHALIGQGAIDRRVPFM